MTGVYMRRSVSLPAAARLISPCALRVSCVLCSMCCVFLFCLAHTGPIWCSLWPVDGSVLGAMLCGLRMWLWCCQRHRSPVSHWQVQHRWRWVLCDVPGWCVWCIARVVHGWVHGSLSRGLRVSPGVHIWHGKPLPSWHVLPNGVCSTLAVRRWVCVPPLGQLTIAVSRGKLQCRQQQCV